MSKSSQMTHDVAIVAASRIAGTDQIRVVFEIEGERREDVFARLKDPSTDRSEVACATTENGMLEFLELHNIGLIRPLLQILRQVSADKPIDLPIISHKIP